MPGTINIRQEKSDKVIRFKTARGTLVSLVREVYLKSDIPCRTSLCDSSLCKDELDVQKLPADTKILCIVDGSVALHYWELFEFSRIQGTVLTLTTLNYVQQVGGKRFYNRIKRSLKDPGQSSVLFDNEFHEECFVPQLPQESTEDYATRMNYCTAQWYRSHLFSHVVVMLVSENPRLNNIIAMYSHEDNRMEGTNEILCFTMPQLLQQEHYASLKAAHELFDSLRSSLAAESEVKETTAIRTEDGYHPRELLVSGLSSGSLLRGTLSVNKFNSMNEAIVTVSDVQVKEMEHRGEVLILGPAARNRAIHGDTVCIELLPRSEWRAKDQKIVDEGGDASSGEASTDNTSASSYVRIVPSGRIVGILSRNWRDYVCCLEEKDQCEQIQRGAVLVTPWDRRIPRIRITSSQVSDLRNTRFIVRIDDWELNSACPRGHFVQSLGPIGDLDVETQTLLIEHGLPNRSFTDAQMKELPVNTPENPWCISPSEEAKRRDLRSSHLIFSIDPLGCQDVDDTLSIRQLGNGLIELGVHIADVTHFVQAHSLLDLEARVRSTSIYLADRRIDMLPHVLSGDLCSLWSNVDRYAVSVIWVMNKDTLEVKDVWYGRTLIRSRYKLHYELAQEIYEGKYSSPRDLVDKIPELKLSVQNGGNAETLVTELREAITNLVHTASAIQERRLEGGGLELEGLEVQVVFSDPERKNMDDLLPKQPLQMHETIAECMIFANHYVAKRILKTFRNQSCLRNHPPPRQDYFDQLKMCASALDFEIRTDTNKTLAESLTKANVDSDPMVNRILRTMATQAMSNATYFSTGSIAREEFSHYGLALDLYTHFTSPIRRYADIIVHRLLLAALELEEGGTYEDGLVEDIDATLCPHLLSNTQLVEQCRHMNEQHRKAQYVGRASVEMFQAMFFRNSSQNDKATSLAVAEAIVYSVRDNGFIALVPRYGIKCAIPLKLKDGKVAWLDVNGQLSWVPASQGCLVQKQKSGVSLHIRHPDYPDVQEYRIFDHVLVKLSASESVAHGLQVKGDFLGRVSSQPLTMSQNNQKISEKQDSSMSKDDVVKSVKAAAAVLKTSGQKRAAGFEHSDSDDEADVYNPMNKNMRQIHNSTGQYLFFKQMCSKLAIQ